MEIEKSLPTRGAWIEIRPWLPAHPAAHGRPPRGERGLKSGLYRDSV